MEMDLIKVPSPTSMGYRSTRADDSAGSESGPCTHSSSDSSREIEGFHCQGSANALRKRRNPDIVRKFLVQADIDRTLVGSVNLRVRDFKTNTKSDRQ
jgi:hypothetical protein